MIEDLTHALEKAAHEDNTQTGISTQKVYQEGFGREKDATTV